MKSVKLTSLAIAMLICVLSFGQEKTIDTNSVGCRKVSYRMVSNKFPKPIYILNGYITTERIVKNLNPNNIASVNILKGEGAIAIYGQKAMSGVIIITTKQLSRKELRKLKKQSTIEINNQLKDSLKIRN